ncbi:MAG TPA: hypothetical protein VIT44_02960 [Cyclobacteriaceae bacterium]
MSKVVGLLVFLLSGTLSFGSSLDWAPQPDSKRVVAADYQVSKDYNAHGHSIAEQTSTPRSDNSTTKFIKAPDIVLQGVAISICQHDLDIIEVFSLYSTNEYHNAFSNPPDQIAFFNLLFRVIISPNAP